MKSESFRANVGIVLSKNGKIFVFERADVPGAWQLPQGGVDAGETLIDTVYRELFEETGLKRSDVRFVDVYPEWLTYEFPEGVKKGNFLGQSQRWFFLELLADESAINLTGGDHQEFTEFRTVEPHELEALAVSFRKPTYQKLAAYMNTDTRNVVDKYRHQTVEAIIADLDTSRVSLEIAIENIERDFNMGTIVRNANAFNVTKVHIIGRRQWNKRGAMKTDAYLHIEYHESPQAFMAAMDNRGKEAYAIDIVPNAEPLHTVEFPENTVMVFGSEGAGVSEVLQRAAAKVVMIEQFGSTRSVNVGVASGVAMYAWMQQHVLRSPR